MAEPVKTTERRREGHEIYIETGIDFPDGFFYNGRCYERIFISSRLTKIEGTPMIMNDTAGLGVPVTETAALELIEKSVGTYGLEIINEYTYGIISMDLERVHKELVKRILEDYHEQKRVRNLITKAME